jgi:peptidoglycan/LPS O-acetylase OafA/YrhL
MVEQLSKGRVPGLDGFRGVAILSVLVFHYVSQEGLTQPRTIASGLQRTVILGWSGVDMFFVLSGFLIGGILIDARKSPSYYRTFYLRRFFRIVPIYYLWIILYIALIFFAGARVRALSHSGAMPPLDFSVYAHFLFLQNFGIANLGGLAGAWFGHLWSLAVEEQFYLLVPLLVRYVAIRRLPVVLVAVIACVPLLRIFLLQSARVSAPLVTVLMPCRADALAIGMLGATLYRVPAIRDWLERNTAKLYVSWAVLFAGTAAFWFLSPQSGTYAMQTIGFTWLAAFYVIVLLLAIGKHAGPIARLMKVGWLREVGTVSYCMYVIHVVVNVASHAILLHSTPRISTWKGAVVSALAALLTYGISKLSWVFVENPLLRHGHAFRYEAPATSLAE